MLYFIFSKYACWCSSSIIKSSQVKHSSFQCDSACITFALLVLFLCVASSYSSYSVWDITFLTSLSFVCARWFGRADDCCCSRRHLMYSSRSSSRAKVPYWRMMKMSYQNRTMLKRSPKHTNLLVSPATVPSPATTTKMLKSPMKIDHRRFKTMKSITSQPIAVSLASGINKN